MAARFRCSLSVAPAERVLRSASSTSFSIRAKVSLGLRVLSYNDLPPTHAGHALFLAHQVAKEAMAALARTADLSAVTGGSFTIGG